MTDAQTLPMRTTTERLEISAMKFVLACYGSRGDVEPGVAVGRELLRRGHEVRMAVPPDLVGFAEAAGLAAVAYGPDLRAPLEVTRNFWTFFFRNFWRIQDLIRLWREGWELATQHRGEMSTTLTSLADGADLLFTGLDFEDIAANVAEYYDIPLATLHWLPIRANGQVVPILPAPLGRSAMTVYEWLAWHMAKKLEDAERRQLGLPKATGPWPRRITERGSLEIQAYDEVCFPGLAAEWAKWNSRRPFVGALTMELPTDADEEVASWIAAGTPPIFFGFGSFPVESAADTLAMISAVCAQLGERGLVCAAGTDFQPRPPFRPRQGGGRDEFRGRLSGLPRARAPRWRGHHGHRPARRSPHVDPLDVARSAARGAAVKRLKVGTARRFSTTTQKSLVADLRRILAPQYVARAREIATQMTKPAESVAAAADLLENFARLRRVG